MMNFFSRRTHCLIAPLIISACAVFNLIITKFSFPYLYFFALLFFVTFLLIDYGLNINKAKNSFQLYCFFSLGVFFFHSLQVDNLDLFFVYVKGIAIYLLFPLYWMLYFMHFDEKEFWAVIRVFIKIISIPTAVCGLIQYFFSYTLFGLYDSNWSTSFLYYTQATDYKTLFRATSILGSPQINSLFMAFSLIFYIESEAIKFKKNTLPLSKFFFVALLVAGGLVSGAKSFLFLFAVYAIIKNFNYAFKFLLVSVLVLGTVTLVFDFSELSQYRIVNRILNISDVLNEESSHSGRIATYKNLFNTSFQDKKWLFGDGPGTHMAFADLAFGTHKATESYLLQIYIELGVAVFFFFIGFIVYSFFCSAEGYTIIIKKILMIEFISMIFIHGFNSPALFIFWAPFFALNKVPVVNIKNSKTKMPQPI
ncbi:hypothetical protein [Legionella sp. km772]|uniref:hypothetical protein n=1 Tax=Legionella sp. km772 TaxID=2498111 RepID=UPI000F8CB664|nr:hypothetical protein [Legionella sp. km772]RUR12740.1 hypothetical protein ELY15_04100 [Legionella sp. km772]